MPIRTDGGGGGTCEYLGWLAGQGLSYSVGSTLTDELVAKFVQLPTVAWTPAYDADRKVRDGADRRTPRVLDLRTWPAGMR